MGVEVAHNKQGKISPAGETAGPTAAAAVAAAGAAPSAAAADSAATPVPPLAGIDLLVGNRACLAAAARSGGKTENARL